LRAGHQRSRRRIALQIHLPPLSEISDERRIFGDGVNLCNLRCGSGPRTSPLHTCFLSPLAPAHKP
jgi:hypothetical protein